MQKAAPYSSSRTLHLILTSMSIALVFVATFFIRVPTTPSGGLVHLGTAMMFIIALVLGPKKGAASGAIGMGLFDIVSNYTPWAPGTIIARGLQGYIVGKIAWSGGRQGDSILFNIIGMVLSMPVMLGVYYVHEAILLSSWIAPMKSIPGNIAQNLVGLAIAIPVAIALKKTPFFKKYQA
ncbi:ECF transporter S component [Exiguobacterium flavidum]|uniref:ECF transporter S component n=1 Tax=Exiguobacterium flavidum TaxID=2184695 RepID=UPI000DF76A39|nr:ECF transporter S component [Exiguobacterium flavidum]